MSQPDIPKEAPNIQTLKYIEPMRATLTHDHFSDPDWLYERKLDGERCVVVKVGSEVTLYSRNKHILNATYPEIVHAVKQVYAGDFVVDGELVAFKDGQTSFSRLQKRMQVTQPDQAVIARTAIFLYLFDVLCLNDRDLRPLPLQTRKQLLKQAISFSSRHIRYTLHRRADGVAFWREACAKGWEGVIAKRAASTYASIRSQDWLKFKCVADQELVIGGYTAPAGERFGFGALLVGYYEAGALRYAGKVGTGFDEETLRYLYDLFQEYTRSTSPFADPTGEQRVTWLSPKFVAEIGFTEWTHEGKLRHPRFKGLRQDKRPKEVSKESI